MSGSTAPRKPDTSPLETIPYVSVPVAQRQDQPLFQSSSRNQSESHDRYTFSQDVQRHSTDPTVFSKPKSHSLSQFRRAQTGFDQQSPAPSRNVWSQVSDIGRRFKARHGNPENFQSAQNPRRQSTINTKYSLPFEKTRAWDQKAILSLGELSLYLDKFSIAALAKATSRWWRYQRLLSFVDHSGTHEEGTTGRRTLARWYQPMGWSRPF